MSLKVNALYYILQQHFPASPCHGSAASLLTGANAVNRTFDIAQKLPEVPSNLKTDSSTSQSWTFKIASTEDWPALNLPQNTTTHFCCADLLSCVIHTAHQHEQQVSHQLPASKSLSTSNGAKTPIGSLEKRAALIHLIMSQSWCKCACRAQSSKLAGCMGCPPKRHSRGLGGAPSASPKCWFI